MYPAPVVVLVARLGQAVGGMWSGTGQAVGNVMRCPRAVRLAVHVVRSRTVHGSGRALRWSRIDAKLAPLGGVFLVIHLVNQTDNQRDK